MKNIEQKYNRAHIAIAFYYSEIIRLNNLPDFASIVEDRKEATEDLNNAKKRFAEIERLYK